MFVEEVQENVQRYVGLALGIKLEVELVTGMDYYLLFFPFDSC